ncbi:MAG TPA: type II secretion system F family protein [Thermoanaerobaculia bacterium]|jgi:type IV pilus assembly protein PilC|nr:type II secretion system F family protein [Thermoanaerobaculia bacterium]
MQFICRVGTQDGRVLEEVFTASDETALRSDLGKLGYHLFEVRRRGTPKLAMPGLGRGGRRRIPAQEFVVFNQELAALLKAGLPLLQTLDLMLERMHNQAFKAVLTDVRDRVKSGEDLSEAFAAHGDLFPRLYPSSLKAGEKSGELEQVIRRFIRYMKLVLDARRRVVSALVYPAVLVCLSIGMIAIMAVYVVPKFMSFFTELGTDLPLITQVVLSISQFATQNWPIILLGLGVGFFALRSWGNTETGRLALDRLKLRVPFLGPVLHRFAMSEFCRSLSTLLSGGIPLVPAFEIATTAVSNAYVRSRVAPTIQLVREGKAFFSALEASEIFTDMAIDMVKVGETTGSLDDMLSSVSDFLDEQVETRMQRLLSLVEPLMLVFMGTIIAILLVSIYLPMFSMLGSSKF